MKKGFIKKEVAEITGLRPSFIAYHTNKGFITPSVSPGTGSGSNRLYSVTDIFKFLLIRQLSENGLSLKKIKPIIDKLKDGMLPDTIPNAPRGGKQKSLIPPERILLFIYDSFKDDFVFEYKIIENPYYNDPLIKASSEKGFDITDGNVLLRIVQEAGRKLDAILMNITVNLADHTSALVVDITDLWQTVWSK